MINIARHVCLLLLITTGLSTCSNADIPRFMENYLWEDRVILVFAPSPDDARLVEQKKMLFAPERRTERKERDIRIISLIDRHSVAIDNKVQPRLFSPPFYDHYNIERDHFALILIGKDGMEKLRSHNVMDIEALFQLIDSMPMRQKEMNK